MSRWEVKVKVRSCLGLAGPTLILLLFATQVSAQTSPPAVQGTDAVPGVTGIIDAFAHYPIVAIADEHGLAQEQDFYAAVVRDPRFADEVGTVVVEFGSAARQATLDRYLAGHPVPYQNLREVWTDTVEGAWTSLGYMNLLAQVRATNRALPEGKKIRVLLGDPPINWSTVRAKADLLPIATQRNSYPAELIQREILEKKKKALVIYGGGHLFRRSGVFVKGASADPRTEPALKAFLSDLKNGSINYTSMVPATADAVRTSVPGWRRNFEGYGKLDSLAFQGRFSNGDMFALKFPNKNVDAGIHLNDEGKIDVLGFGSIGGDGDDSITDRIERKFPNSVFYVAPHTGHRDGTCNESFEAAYRDATEPLLVKFLPSDGLSGRAADKRCREGRVVADGLLFLGPAARLTMSPEHPDIYLDEAYRAEESRRRQLAARPLPSVPDMLKYRAEAKRYD